MDFSAITGRSLAIRRLFEEYEREAYGRPWSLEEVALGLVGDVGDLAELIQAREGVRKIEDLRSKLEHELADVLWSVIIIAAECEIDLEASFTRTMDGIEKSLSEAKPA
jgi:NTP pyrophosphatase (non-canonical NTP hydrolase)